MPECIEIAKYDNQDRLLKWRDHSYTYNDAGDLKTRTSPAGATDYVYDALGALRGVRLPSGKAITYDIDPSGRRTGKSVDGQLQWHLVWQSELRPLAQLKPDGSIDAVFYYAEHVNVPSAMRKGGKDYQIVTDHLGSVRLVIDVNTAQVAQRMSYDAWGAVIEDSNPGFQPFGFAGGLYDPDTQLTRFGARDYDGETGRWTAKDPILFRGGDSNLYGYVVQNPVNFIDQTGLAKDGQPLNLENCSSLKKLIEYEDIHGKFKTLGKYNTVSFNSEFVSLDAAFPSTGGPVSIDWMLRSGGAGMTIGMAHFTYSFGKIINNSIHLNNPFLNISGEANWNAPTALQYWMHNDHNRWA